MQSAYQCRRVRDEPDYCGRDEPACCVQAGKAGQGQGQGQEACAPGEQPGEGGDSEEVRARRTDLLQDAELPVKVRHHKQSLVMSAAASWPTWKHHCFTLRGLPSTCVCSALSVTDMCAAQVRW